MPFRTARRRLARLLLVPLASALVGGLLSAIPAPSAQARPTALDVEILADGLTNPWDVTWVGDVLLFNERVGRVWSKRGGAAPREVDAPLSDLFVNNEGGLLGMVADPAAARNKRFYVCYVARTGSTRDVRVVRWRLASDTRAVRDGSDAVVVKGMPVNPDDGSAGRHSGCRLRFGPDGMLYVATGDGAIGSTPQDLQNLGGKVLRVRGDGRIPTDNPFYRRGGNARYVYTYGHRNPQGLAFRPGTRELWSAEHGPGRDDEVNLVTRGSNYGWNPVPGAYNESVPMTDRGEFPRARAARWSSGTPTVAPSGLTFLTGSAWGRWEGALAVGLLRGRGIRLLYLDPATRVVSEGDVAEVDPYGRIRAVQTGPDGALYFTTSNSDPDNPRRDVLGRIRPTAKPPTVKAGTNISPVAPAGVRTAGDVYAFIRTTDDRVEYKRSTDDGRTWPRGWTDTRLTSTSAPGAASSRPGRVDLVTRNRDRTVTHTWLVDGRRRGQTNLGGSVTAASVSSLGDGTVDVLVLSPSGNAFRKRWNGRSWSGWQRLAGGPFTSAIGASAEPATRKTLISARGRTGTIYQRTLTPGGNGTGWTRTSGQLWSGRALGDRLGDRPRVGMSRTYDGMARWQRGAMVTVLELPLTSDPDVVARPDGTWLVLARNPSGGLSVYDARPGAYAARSLGGRVR